MTKLTVRSPMIFLRDWILVVAMISGVAAYAIYAACPPLRQLIPWAGQAVTTAQPVLIFMMLFLTFCRIELRKMRLRPWHIWLLLIQGGLFCGLSAVLIMLPHSGLRVVLEGAMLCLICPTATAAAVVTRKLGGDVTAITTYTILINLLVATLVPLTVPYVHPHPGMSTAAASWMILGKVFPLLLMPLVAALLVKHLLPGLCHRLLQYRDLPFYMWAVALTLAIAVTARSVVNSQVDIATMVWLVVVSAVTCALQFRVGRAIGTHYGDTVTAGQALGQKNTVLVIWMGYTFYTPVTALVGGFYSIWHNVYNTLQLRRHQRQSSPTPSAN